MRRQGGLVGRRLPLEPPPPRRGLFSLSLDGDGGGACWGVPRPRHLFDRPECRLTVNPFPTLHFYDACAPRVNGNACRSAGVAGGRTPCGSKCPKASAATVFFFPSSPRTASAVPPRAALRHAPGRQRARVTGTGCTLTLGRESWGGVCVRWGGRHVRGERARRQDAEVKRGKRASPSHVLQFRETHRRAGVHNHTPLAAPPPSQTTLLPHGRHNSGRRPTQCLGWAHHPAGARKESRVCFVWLGERTPPPPRAPPFTPRPPSISHPRPLKSFLTIVEVIMVCAFGAILAHVVSGMQDKREKGGGRFLLAQPMASGRHRRRRLPTCTPITAPRHLACIGSSQQAPEAPAWVCESGGRGPGRAGAGGREAPPQLSLPWTGQIEMGPKKMRARAPPPQGPAIIPPRGRGQVECLLLVHTGGAGLTRRERGIPSAGRPQKHHQRPSGA